MNITNRNLQKKKQTQADKILKWKHFDNIKIKTYPHNSLNICKSCKKPWTFLMYIRWNQNKLTRPKCHRNPKNTNKKKNPEKQ